MLIDSYCMDMNVLLYVCACTPCVPDACVDTKAQDLLEPELWVGVSCQEGDQPWVSGKSSQCSSVLELSQQPLNVCLKIEKSTVACLSICYNV